MHIVKVSSRSQITLPAGVRRQLGIEQGDRLLVDVRGDHLLIMREPRDYAAALAGLHSEVWQGVDPQQYIDELRDERDR